MPQTQLLRITAPDIWGPPETFVSNALESVYGPNTVWNNISVDVVEEEDDFVEVPTHIFDLESLDRDFASFSYSDPTKRYVYFYKMPRIEWEKAGRPIVRELASLSDHLPEEN